MKIHGYRISFNEPMNPNHKLRVLGSVLVPGEKGGSHTAHLATIAFAKRDESLYLSFGWEGGEIRAFRESKSVLRSRLSAGGEAHVSFHHSGVVNVTVGEKKVKLRGRSRPSAQEPLFTLGFANARGFRRVPERAISDHSFTLDAQAKRRDILAGFVGDGAVSMLSVFRMAVDQPVPDEPLVVADGNPVEFVIDLREKGVRYHLAKWTPHRPLAADFEVYVGAPPGGIPDLPR